MIADDHGPEYVPSIAGMTNTSPVQYCGFGEPTTLLQKALHRARHIAPTTQIAVTAMPAEVGVAVLFESSRRGDKSGH